MYTNTKSKEEQAARNNARAISRQQLSLLNSESREGIAERLRAHGISARGLGNRIFRGRRLTATQAYALPSVYDLGE